jgi:hypothetical protein
MSTDIDEKKAEAIVAYLDGELDDVASDAVERLLAENPEYRARVEEHTRAWDLLDLLPSRKASASFTEKTITAIKTTTVSADAETEAQADQIPSHARLMTQRTGAQWGLRVIAFFGLLFVAAIGFNQNYRFETWRSDEVLKDYPTLNRLHELRDAGDVEFLRELKQRKVFHEQRDDDSRPQ